MTRALVIINGNSRSGEAARCQVIELLREAGLELRVPEIGGPADIAPAIRAHAGEVETVVLGGGDGTMQCAAEALAGSGLTLGIVPLGTANDLARTLGIPADIAAACRIIAAGKHQAVDLGRVNGRYFFNVAHIGLGVEVKRALNPQTKRLWGAFSYPRAALHAWRRQLPFQALIRSGGREISLSAIQIGVGNGRFYGGGMAVHQHASISDGLLDLYAIRPVSGWEMLGACAGLKLGRMEDIEGFLQINTETLSVATPEPMEVSADGEVITTTPAEFSVAVRAVRVFVSREQEGGQG